MALNSTCIAGANSTVHCTESSSSSLALAVSLPVIFIILGIVIVAIFYLRHKKSKETTESGKLKSTDQEHAMASGSPYTSYTGNKPPAPCNPIYENYQHRNTEPSTAQQSSVDGERTDSSPCSPDDLYMQCDTNDPIYNNDPTFYRSNTGTSEDLYILPDS